MSRVPLRRVETSSIDVDAWAAELDPKVLRCRDKGHDMDDRLAEETKWGFWRMWICARCEKYRYEEDLDRSGNVLLRHSARYGDNYLAPKGVAGVVGRGDITAAVRQVRLQGRVKGAKRNMKRERGGGGGNGSQADLRSVS